MNDRQHKHTLPAGYELNGYRLVSVLGVGGFGVTYLARHVRLGQRVAIKEYLPNEFAVREGTAVHPKSIGDRESFDWGLDRFLEEARTLALFEHRNLVRVRDYFEANATAYFVMNYEEGESLDRLLTKLGRLSEPQLKRIVLPIVDGLRIVHSTGFLHRDIKPSNIYVRRSDESPVLLDFGAARQALGRKSHILTAVASAGYSPPEQYESEGEQGPWSDVYSLSALCYRAISGETPAEATKRQGRLLRGQPDPLTRLSELAPEGYSRELLSAVDWGLRVIETERPVNVDDWETALAGRETSESDDALVADVAATKRVAGSGRISKNLLWAFSSAAVLALGVGSFWYLANPGTDSGLVEPIGDIATSPEQLDTQIAEPAMNTDPASDTAVLGGGSAMVVVETIPAGVEVRINGEFAGNTPLELNDMRAGVHDVELSHPDYETVFLPDQGFGDGRVLRIERELLRATGALTVVVQPRVSWIELNGVRLAETTPITLENLPAGTVELTLGAERHHVEIVTAEVPRDGVGMLDWALDPVPYGTLTLELEPPDATARLPDISPSYSPGMELAEGEYLVEVRAEWYRSRTLAVEVSGNTRERIELEDDFDLQGTYQMFCFACHSTGLSGAPLPGDAEAWGPRMEKGRDEIVAIMNRGLNAMPPKGLCMTCTDDQLWELSQYMVNMEQ